MQRYGILPQWNALCIGPPTDSPALPCHRRHLTPVERVYPGTRLRKTENGLKSPLNSLLSLLYLRCYCAGQVLFADTDPTSLAGNFQASARGLKPTTVNFQGLPSSFSGNYPENYQRNPPPGPRQGAPELRNFKCAIVEYLCLRRGKEGCAVITSQTSFDSVQNRICELPDF